MAHWHHCSTATFYHRFGVHGRAKCWLGCLLCRTLTKTLRARMGRKPSKEEASQGQERVAAVPLPAVRGGVGDWGKCWMLSAFTISLFVRLRADDVAS